MCNGVQDELSGADIKAICTEAGLLALRERRMKVTRSDLKLAKDKVLFNFQKLFVYLTSLPGHVQEERRCPGRPLPLIKEDPLRHKQRILNTMLLPV